MKNNKGITLIVLIMTVVVLLIITATISYNSSQSLEIKSYTKLKSDIELLHDRVLVYYSNYGTLPTKGNVILKSNLNIPQSALNSKDNDNYYVINLEVLKNMTLNYGRGYEDLENSDDVYIINENSQTIYYLQGIELEGTVYYTI